MTEDQTELGVPSGALDISDVLTDMFSNTHKEIHSGTRLGKSDLTVWEGANDMNQHLPMFASLDEVVSSVEKSGGWDSVFQEA